MNVISMPTSARRVAAVRVLGAGDEVAEAALREVDVETLLAPARKEIALAVAALKAAAQQLTQKREGLVQQAEGQMVELALSVARKVLMQEIQAGRYEIDPIVQEALKSVSTQVDVLIHLNPADLEQCTLARQGSEGLDGNFRFVADATVARASCLVETAEGTVEASVEKHLEGIEAALRNLE